MTNNFLQPADASLATQLAHPPALIENDGILVSSSKELAECLFCYVLFLSSLIYGAVLGQCHLRDTKDTVNSFYLGFCKNLLSLREFVSYQL